MKKNYIFILFILSSIRLFSQETSIGDCVGAIPLCGDLYSEEQSSFTLGNEFEYTGVCNQFVEQNSVWYTFTVQQDGDLSFILTPNTPADDYDWGLFNITNGGCAGITLQDGTSPEVSCNSWGTLIPPNGPTGISTAQGGVSNSSGPGDLLGPPFNLDLPVLEGQVYALVVMNWSNSEDGYTIDFEESTANLYDDVAPVPLSVIGDCSNTNLTIYFSEPILIESIDLGDFSIVGNGNTYSAASFQPFTSGATLDDSIIVTLTNQIAMAGIYTLIFTDSSGYITDVCGNVAVGTLEFELFDPLTFSAQANTACNGTGGSIELVNVLGGLQPYLFYVDGQLQPDSVGDNLTTGLHNATIIDDNNCVVLIDIEVPNTIFSFTALTVAACNGFDGSLEIIDITTGTEPFVFTIDGITQTDLSADSLTAGLHTTTLDDNGICFVTLDIEIPNNPLEVIVPEQDTLTCESPTIFVQGAQVIPEQSLIYNWIFVSENGLDTLSNNSSSPQINRPGVYILYGVNPVDGCEAQTEFTVYSDTTFAIDFSQIVFPNVFSPNNDGVNDSWTPFLLNNPSLELTQFFDVFDLKIFNRWGNLIFEGSKNTSSWLANDELNGEYMYTLSYKLDCGIKLEGVKSGTIRLVN
jgi:gliding motility-associated-like protein